MRRKDFLWVGGGGSLGFGFSKIVGILAIGIRNLLEDKLTENVGLTGLSGWSSVGAGVECSEGLSWRDGSNVFINWKSIDSSVGTG